LDAKALAWTTRCFLTWRAVDCTLKAQITESTVATLGQHNLFTRVEQLVHHFPGFFIDDDGAHWQAQCDVLARSTKHVIAHAVFTALRFMAARITVVNEGVQIHIGHGIDMAASATVTTVGSAEFLVFFVSERGCAITTIARG